MEQKDTTAMTAQRSELTITRLLDAPRALVFAAWTEPARLAEWFGPRGFSIPSFDLDLRPGGAYRFCMRSPEGVDHWVRGVYREVVPPERLSFTWVRENSDGIGVETVVTIMLAEERGKTKLTLHHGGFAAVETRDAHHGGWSSCVDRLPEYLAAAA